MNRFSSYPNHENLIIYERSPPQGLSEARRAGSFFEFFVTDPPRGAPSGAAAIIVPNGESGKNPASYLNTTIFIGKSALVKCKKKI